MWDVVVEAHEIVARRMNGEPSGTVYAIKRLEFRIGGRSKADGGDQAARRAAVQEAHRRAGVPPWRPYKRESWPHSRVRRYMVQVT